MAYTNPTEGKNRQHAREAGHAPPFFLGRMSLKASSCVPARGVVLLSTAFSTFALVAAESDPGLHCTAAVSVFRDASGQLQGVPLSSDGALTHVIDAEGIFDDTLEKTGWGVFEVRTTAGRPDDHQAFAAGYLEGYMTGNRISQNYANLWQYFFAEDEIAEVKSQVGAPLPDLYHAWFQKQDEYTRRQISLSATYTSSSTTNLDDNAYWRQAGLIMHQVDGMKAGLEGFLAAGTSSSHPPPCGTATEAKSKAATAKLELGGASSWQVVTLLNSVGDMIDIRTAFRKAVLDLSARPNVSGQDIENSVFHRSMCSAVFKVLPDFSDILMGHVSWFSYSATNRIFKHYHIHTAPDITAAPSMSFSSYAGFQNSLDDFYMLSSGMVMIQTSLAVIDPDRQSLISETSLLAWQRVRIANALASTGEEWFELFRRENSGTYNNQYMLLDTKRFAAGKPPPEGLLYLVEQIPGLVVGQDITDALQYGYFPSYNMPYFNSVWKAAGYEAAYALTGDPKLTHALAPRGEIFRRDQGSITDIQSLLGVLRSNNYKKDPLSEGVPTDAICARGDLEAINTLPGRRNQAGAYGCIDGKVTSVLLSRNMTALAVNGPPSGGASSLPPFAWDDFNSVKKVPHLGLPKKYEFPPVEMRPHWQLANPPVVLAEAVLNQLIDKESQTLPTILYA